MNPTKGTAVRCGVNDALGGGIFICRRPLSPQGNGAYCEYHGGWPHNRARMELTWRAWFKAWFIYRPRNAWWHLKRFVTDARLAWHTRHNPRCATSGCRKRSIAEPKVGVPPACINHLDFGDP